MGEARGYGEHVEGPRAVRELLTAQRRRVRTVWVASDHDGNPALDEIVVLARDAAATVRTVDRARIAELAHTDAPQGVVARADPIEPVDYESLLHDSRAFLVALDGVTDPRNLGAVARAAEAAGATGLVLPRRRSVPITAAATKAAAGALEYLAVAFVSGIPAALGSAARAGVWTVGLDVGGDALVSELDVADRPLVLVLGAEGSGMSRLARERCDILARIPMYGHVASLNVAAAAAIACGEIARRRHR